MKKSFIGVFVLISIIEAQSSGVFIGVNYGLSMLEAEFSDFTQNIGYGRWFPQNQTGKGWGVDVGYKKALTEENGLKFYLSYNYNETKGFKDNGVFGSIDSHITQKLITANVDYYFNATRFFGAYIGFGIGYQEYNPIWNWIGNTNPLITGRGAKGGLAVPLNIGLTLNVSNSNQITLGAKIPLASYNYDNDDGNRPDWLDFSGVATFRASIVQVGYNFTF